MKLVLTSLALCPTLTSGCLVLETLISVLGLSHQLLGQKNNSQIGGRRGLEQERWHDAQAARVSNLVYSQSFISVAEIKF